MKKSAFLLRGAIGGAFLFAAPFLLLSYTFIGGSLGIGTSGNGYQRDVRIFNNAADAAANNNTTPDPSYPGALGASMAVWKGAAAWKSNDPNAACNFDMDWQGANTSNPFNNNTADWTTSGCGGGTLAFTETPISDGWRIRFCESGILWADGPGSIGFSEYDIQATMAHEYGHALGLGHTNIGCSGCNVTTMCPFLCNGNTSQRTIATDDKNGLCALYGTIPANKPLITSLSGSQSTGGTLVINGTNFASTVNVKFTAGTSQNTGTIPGVVYNVPASPTQISVVIPSTALDGNVLVWEPSQVLLSNAFPIDINFVPPPPPTITGVSPPTVQAFQGGTITLTGTGFTGATQVNSGGTILTPPFGFTIVSDTTITYGAPTAATLGLTTVNVTTPNGTSNNGTFTYVETNPPKLAAAGFAFQGTNFNWSFAGGAGDTNFLLFALNPTTFSFGGFNILLNFSILTSGPLDAVGLGSFSLFIPTGTGGITFYSQTATLDGGSGAFVGASNITTTFIF